MPPKQKIAAKHLDKCEIVDCKFASSGICSFGLRHEGCIYFNPEIQRRLMLLASVEARLTVAKYGEDAYWAARTRDEQIDFPSFDNIIEPVLENIGKITKKVYGFVFEGHEYNYRDNSMDYGSCPHCGHLKGHSIIGYYGSGKGRIVCFECASCFKKFYYHAPKGDGKK